MTDISVWYKNLPVFTKYWLTLTAGFSLLARFGILQGHWLHLAPYFVTSKFQVRKFNWNLMRNWLIIRVFFKIWRLATCVFYYPLNPATGFHFMLNCYFLYNYSLRLETDHFKQSPADYFFLLIFNWLCCVIIGIFFNLPVSLTAHWTIVHMWRVLYCQFHNFSCWWIRWFCRFSTFGVNSTKKSS